MESTDHFLKAIPFALPTLDVTRQKRAENSALEKTRIHKIRAVQNRAQLRAVKKSAATIMLSLISYHTLDPISCQSASLLIG
jgi:hypothetical protein